MGHVSKQAVGTILDNYADVIEGGNVWAGGTSYSGIPGTHPSDPELRNGTDTPITSSMDSQLKTEVIYGSGAWSAARWEKEDIPGYFLLCTSNGNSASLPNVNAARRITAWSLSNTKFTVDAFDVLPYSGDQYDVLQGFKRMPNQLDIEEEETESDRGWDRFFQMRVGPPSRMDWSGKHSHTYKAELQLRLRIEKFAREHDSIASVFENLSIIRSVLTLGTHRESAYTRALVAEEDQQAEIVKEDSKKVVAADTYTLIYRVDRTFK